MTDPIHDRARVPEVLADAAAAATRYLESVDSEPITGNQAALRSFGGSLPEHGRGSRETMAQLSADGLAAATRSTGPRYFHFVRGGATPAALGGDWLASALDENAVNWVSAPFASHMEDVVVSWLKELFSLPVEWGGVLTTGATMASFTGLAAARCWWAGEHGVDFEDDGFERLPAVPVFTGGYMHASVLKALAMLGVGRRTVRQLSADSTGRFDVNALRSALHSLRGSPAIVVATAGCVATGDFDPVEEIVDLAHKNHAWVHVDGAFGLFARLAERTAHLVHGVEHADSISVAGHKWLNVPYECGIAFARDGALMQRAFWVSGDPEFPRDGVRVSFGNLGPEAGRRARALSVWATLNAYGRSGYQELIDRHLDLAARLGAQVQAAEDFELLAPVQLNVVCFRYRPPGVQEPKLDTLNQRIAGLLSDDGRVFFGAASYRGQAGFRPAITNWRTTQADVDMIVTVTREIGQSILEGT